MTDRETRKIWRRYFADVNNLDQPFPEALRGLTCGATTRAGTLCKQKGLYSSGRCKLHGGLSTGPITEEGKRKAAANGFKPKKSRVHGTLTKPNISRSP